MDWKNLEADVTKILPCHFYYGRNGSIQAVTIHHMAGDLSIDDCYRVWTNREASAHYAVQSDGTIGQLVNDWDTAWACGHDWANNNTISIEHANNSSNPWTVYPEVLDAGAHLTAAICVRYNLGEPTWMVNVYPHCHWQATACPGELNGSQNAEYMERAKAYYHELVGDGDAPAPVKPQPSPTPSPTPSGSSGASVRYRARVGGSWLDECVDHTDPSGDGFAGIFGSPIEYIAVDMPGRYRARTQASGWLPWVYNYNVNDLENGCAGDGSPITGIECYYETQNPNSTGWLGIEYAAHTFANGWLPNMIDDVDTGGSGDHFAGDGSVIDGFRARIVNV